MAGRVVCPFCETPRSVRRDGKVVVHKHGGTGRRCFGSERESGAMPFGPDVVRTGFETRPGAERYARKRNGRVFDAYPGETTPSGDKAVFVVEEVR